MFAIIEDGGRQYRVQAGDKVHIDYRAELRDGDALRFERILAAGTEATATIGQPLISGAVVEATVVDDEVRARKLEIGKFRRRKGHIRHNGHIQRHTLVRVMAIEVPGFEKVLAPVAPPAAPAPEAPASAAPAADATAAG
ncbi:MAG: 50S ribosomal protein L21 [Planctomycetota bacterium]|nr:50S ribosomal protein L21 [Planctomycetota bacterium]